MKNFRTTKRVAERALSRRRSLGARAINELLARRRRLRQGIGVAVAMGLSIGLLLAEFA